MPRRNQRSHKPKRQRYDNPLERPRSMRVSAPQPNLRNLVLPVGKCGRKLMFTEADAPAALRQAREKHKNGDRMGKIEKRFYPCDRCQHYHLTSREEWTPREGDAS